MTITHEVAAYCLGKLGPGQIETYSAFIRDSKLSIAILGFLHIGRTSIQGQNYGDLIFNDYPSDLLISRGVSNPGNSPEIAAWPKQVAQLKQNSSVQKIFLSIGGQGEDNIFDFRTIEFMLTHDMAGVLEQNFFMLKQFFTVGDTCAIDGFDLDCEEDVEDSTIVSFSKLLFQLGFEVTFCPYEYMPLWQGRMQQLWNLGYKVSWWNLQCFDGGYRNRTQLQTWINGLGEVVGNENAASYLMLGLAVKGSTDGQCPCGPGSINETFRGWSQLGLRGGFLWNYDIINENFDKSPCDGAPAGLENYVHAVFNGLNDKRC